MKILVLFLVWVISATGAEKADSGKVTVETKSVDEKRILGKVKTIYTVQGRPTQQRRAAKGWHQVADAVKLAGGRAMISLNTSTIQGRQDVSFIDKTTYRGQAFSLDTLNNFIYQLIPLSGKQFLIKSSSATDTATVNFLAEGE
jgi:hypothetical protein